MYSSTNYAISVTMLTIIAVDLIINKLSDKIANGLNLAEFGNF